MERAIEEYVVTEEPFYLAVAREIEVDVAEVVLTRALDSETVVHRTILGCGSA